MSIISEGRAVCSHCKESNSIKIYKSINVAEQADLKEKVKDGSLFLWECPHCGTVNLARYDALYHDPDKKIMIWLLVSDEISQAQMKAIANHTKSIGGYVLRTVSDTGSLMEKVLIHEARLDDVAIELCKWVSKQEMVSKLEDEEKIKSILARNLHFYKTEGDGETKFITFTFAENGQMLGLNIGWNVYEDACGILQRNPSVRPQEAFAKVDYEWISSIIKH